MFYIIFIYIYIISKFFSNWKYIEIDLYTNYLLSHVGEWWQRELHHTFACLHLHGFVLQPHLQSHFNIPRQLVVLWSLAISRNDFDSLFGTSCKCKFGPRLTSGTGTNYNHYKKSSGFKALTVFKEYWNATVREVVKQTDANVNKQQCDVIRAVIIQEHVTINNLSVNVSSHMYRTRERCPSWDSNHTPSAIRTDVLSHLD